GCFEFDVETSGSQPGPLENLPEPAVGTNSGGAARVGRASTLIGAGQSAFLGGASGRFGWTQQERHRIESARRRSTDAGSGRMAEHPGHGRQRSIASNRAARAGGGTFGSQRVSEIQSWAFRAAARPD